MARLKKTSPNALNFCIQKKVPNNSDMVSPESSKSRLFPNIERRNNDKGGGFSMTYVLRRV
ncbi:MAG: hypothetical protein JNK51_03015 [Blastocatellia bacterium]|nr:hypothetical protein [Chloracidobacterium sp.]MBL8183871.1 hypothetical protein [Blastocatellia bacterium]